MSGLGVTLPPGPLPKPLIGNLTDMPAKSAWETVTKWGHQYGEIVYVEVLGRPMVYLNSMEAVKTLFDKRSALYADRPISYMLTLAGWDYNVGFMPYGSRWREHRTLFHQHFHSGVISKYYPIQLKHTRNLLRGLLRSPEQYTQHIKQFTAAVIMEIMYGITLQDENDPYISIAHEALEGASQATLPGKFLVELFPIMMKMPSWMPGAGFKRQAREWRIPTLAMVERPFEKVKKDLAMGIENNSVTATCLENLVAEHTVEDVKRIANMAGVSYAAGASTTVAGMRTLILALVFHPEVQRKAQAELDSVLSHRLPDFEDRPHLPYVVAVCNEIHRWRPPLPLAIPHVVTQDDTYGKYFIPKGALVTGNAWGIFRDESIFGPNPESFEPERFLNPEVPAPTAQYGFGRRICPGRHLADDTFFIMAASLMKVFNVSPALDAAGNPIEISGQYTTGGTASEPEPFECSITPRGEISLQLIQEQQ